MRRKIISSEIITDHSSMGGIGPGRTVRRRRLMLECGHTTDRKLSKWVGSAANCLACDRLRGFLR